MGLLDCVASPEGRDQFEERDRPISRQRDISRSDHNIARRRGLPIFASQTSLKNVRDIDFWRRRTIQFLFSPEGQEDIGILRVPLKQLGYQSVTDFIAAIPPELFVEYENQIIDDRIAKDFKVFWLRDGIAEPAIFRWNGVLDNVMCMGLQLDRKKAVPFGIHDGKGMFYCKPGHRAMVPAEEVTPYKKFLRRYLGLPPKKDSLVGSVRLSEKALAARNAKTGDRVYLSKQGKWATVQWIGKIDNETVVDLIYEQPKPEDGKPVSPDEPCISRSLSMADFIGELESEPTSPITPTSTQPGHPQTVQATVEQHAGPSSTKKKEKPLVTPLENLLSPKKGVTPPVTPLTYQYSPKDTNTPPVSPLSNMSSSPKRREAPPVSPLSNLPPSKQLETPPVSPLSNLPSPKGRETPPISPLSKLSSSPRNKDAPQASPLSNLSPSKKFETPPVSPRADPDFDESYHSDDEHSSEDDDTETETDDDTETDSEQSVSDASVDGMHGAEESNVVPPTPVMKSYKGMENISTEVLTTTVEDTQRLPSPKRKGFFGFSPKPQKRAKPKSPLPIHKVEPAKALPAAEEPEILPQVEPPQPPPRKSKSTGNLFAGWKFGLPSKKPKQTVQKVQHVQAEPPKEPAKSKVFQKKETSKSDWGLFRTRSKGSSLNRHSMGDPHSPRSPPQTPMDEMFPPDKIPTPPPAKKYNERQIERPVSLDMSASPASERSSVQSPLYVPPKSAATPEELIKEGKRESVPVVVAVPVDNIDNREQTDESDISGEEDESEEETAFTEQPVDTKIGLNEPPPQVPDSPLPPTDSDSEEETQETSRYRKESFKDEDTSKEMQEVMEAEHQDIVTPKENETVPLPPYMEKFKDTKIRNRPYSFGSFLAKMTNQKKKPDEPVPTPRTPVSPYFPAEKKERSPEPNDDGESTQQVSHSQHEPDINEPVEPEIVRPPSPSGSIVELNEDNDDPPTEGMMQISKTLVNPKTVYPKPSESEGNQEGIMLDLLDVQEPPPQPITDPPPTEPEKTPKLKAGKGMSFSFSFGRKRKTSNSGGGIKDKELQLANTTSNEEAITNAENIDPIAVIPQNTEVQLHEETQKEPPKQSKTNSFRNSFKRSFSLTRKKKSSIDVHDENIQAAPSTPPPSNNTPRPRPVTLYIDNNEAVTNIKNSFRSKRPASVHVDIQPWESRRGTGGVDIYSSPSSDEAPSSPLRSPNPNPALMPKSPEPDIPKHRLFTTPAIFARKSKKSESDNEPLIRRPSKTRKKSSSTEDQGTPLSPTGPGKLTKSLSIERPTSPPPTAPPPPPPTSAPPPPPTTSPPPLPAAPPPIKGGGPKRQPSFVIADKPVPVNVEMSSPATKLKSALKQRKEIDSIPKGLKVSDRVIWYSGTRPIPGTVQKLFKDGTDKYTAMVKFDREVPDEPLRLVREGDAYMITVEELITPDMFGAGPAPATTAPVAVAAPPKVIHVTPPTPVTPPVVVTPSVRFGDLNTEGVVNVAMHESESETDEEEELDLPPPFQEEEVSMACGFRRGIQCQDKTCCLETILFSLFYTTNAFDISMLYANTRNEDSVTRNTRRILRRDIVDPLRRNGFCEWNAVKRLRDAVKPLSDEWETLSTDAEVMMFIVFDRALKLGKFISYSNGISDFLHQLVVDPKDLSKSTTVQHLFESSLQLMDNLKLTTVPTPALILEMPRSNDKLQQYKAIIPNLSLHVSHIMENGPRLCICGVVANHECTQCSMHVGNMSIVYCDNCKGTADVIHYQLTHEAQLSPLSQLVIVLDLVAIICVKGGHYSSFVKCGNNNISPWVYFDGAEIDNPKVCIEQNLGMWLDRLEKYPGRYQDALQYPLLTQILQDSHICIYQPREKSSSV